MNYSAGEALLDDISVVTRDTTGNEVAGPQPPIPHTYTYKHLDLPDFLHVLSQCYFVS